MDSGLLVRGLIIGLSVAAPVGPISLLCIQRTLSQGRLVGLSSGLGVATADALYGAIAGFGLTAVASLLVAQQFWLRLLGGLFLIWLGVQIVRTPPAVRAAVSSAAGLSAAYGSILLLTLVGPPIAAVVVAHPASPPAR